MWRPLACQASFLGAVSCLLASGRSLAEPAATSKLTTASATATERPRQPTSPAEQSSQPPAALEEGTHFAVLSGVDGSSSKLVAVAAAMRNADVVLLGEYHDDSVAHALQLALLQHVAARLGHAAAPQPAAAPPRASGDSPNKPQGQRQRPPSRPLILSLEMFETDVQLVLSEYLAGHIPLSDLMKDARWVGHMRSRSGVPACVWIAVNLKNQCHSRIPLRMPCPVLFVRRPWSNYRHDYHHLVEVCKQLQLPVVAANAPRRYVSLAGRAGSGALLQLPAAAKQWLPPLPHAPSSEAYVRKVQHSMRQAAAGMDALRKQQEADDTHQQGSGAAHPDTQQAQQQRKQQQQEQQDEGVSGSSSAVPAAADSKGCPYIGLTVSSNFLAAQSLWDATMAHAIAQALQQHQPQADVPAAAAAAAVHAPRTAQQQPAADASNGGGDSENQPAPTGPLVVHVCGKFHCENRLGIPEHLAAYAPGAKVLVVVFVPAEKLAVTAEEAAAAGLVGAGDFVVLTDAKLPRSFVVEHPV